MNPQQQNHITPIRLLVASLLGMTWLLSVAQAADGILFVHTDHLGTPVAYTNGKGEVVGREYVTPYGESLNSPTGNDQPTSPAMSETVPQG